ncbi:MAG: hypothetical protein R3C99_26525 [Pirellulaceae bacterium]
MAGNLIDATLADADRQEVLTAIQTIRTKLPFLIDLDADAKLELPALGDRSRGFVLRALEGAKQTPDFLPRAFDIEAMERDLNLFNALLPIQIALNQLNELVNDTVHAAGGEAYNDARMVYQLAKSAPAEFGLDSLVNDLKQRFARRSPGGSGAPADV